MFGKCGGFRKGGVLGCGISGGLDLKNDVFEAKILCRNILRDPAYIFKEVRGFEGVGFGISIGGFLYGLD